MAYKCKIDGVEYEIKLISFRFDKILGEWGQDDCVIELERAISPPDVECVIEIDRAPGPPSAQRSG